MRGLGPGRRTFSGTFELFLCVALSSSPGLADDDHNSATANTKAAKVTVSKDGAVHLPPMVVPFSSFASPEAKTPFLANGEFQEKYANA